MPYMAVHMKIEKEWMIHCMSSIGLEL
uniref:Uncharacterized protein n=1 Tax=Chenopodium quinoa TaxID=63459 RepID=A0A803N010_CHEQI